jgi:hypothetical protein
MDEGLLELSELTLALCISSLMELACDELLEPVPERLWLSCCNSLAPGELLEMEASLSGPSWRRPKRLHP